MKILLDTHLLLWWLANDTALSDRARSLIGDPENTIFLSAVTLWEIWLKVSLNKLRLPKDFDERLAREPFENLPLTASQARRVASLPWLHRDPFDRMLIAQAQADRLILLTADEALSAYGDAVLLAR